MVRSIQVVLLLVVIAVVAGQDYCKICADHTMCKFKGDGPACGKKIYGAVDAAAQAEALKVHNDLRRKIATKLEPKNPEAANMREMVWSPELATIAQRWADQCTYSHDTCRDITGQKVGQNVRYTSSTTSDKLPAWTEAVTSWYSEVSLWNSANINPFKSISGAGHFTQVVWAESYKLGCGFSVYPNAGKTTKLYVCNYGPEGNVNGQPMYKVGPACSACPAGTTCKSGLCG